jgi:hypothetical protein
MRQSALPAASAAVGGGWSEMAARLEPVPPSLPGAVRETPKSTFAEYRPALRAGDEGSAIAPSRDRRWPSLPGQPEDDATTQAAALAAFERGQRLDREQRRR